MKKIIIKGKYYWHSFQHHYNELMHQDCLCEELKSKYKVKAIYHNSKAIELAAICSYS